MKRLDLRIVFGILLVIGGVLALADSLGYIENAPDIFVAGILAALGLIFLALVFGGHWWGVFPGFILIAIGALIVLPEPLDEFGGTLFLGGIALAFWTAYSTASRERWWAIIPAGVLTTLAGMTLASERFGSFESSGFFFLGLALTFLLVAVLAGMRWAYWPALVLGVMSLIGFVSLFEIGNLIWAVFLIGFGGFLLFRYFTAR